MGISVLGRVCMHSTAQLEGRRKVEGREKKRNMSEAGPEKPLEKIEGMGDCVKAPCIWQKKEQPGKDGGEKEICPTSEKIRGSRPSPP